MPRGDGTGPMGMGPRTGRAAGYCAGYAMPGFANPIGGRGLGMAWGRGGGGGRAMAWRRGFGLAGQSPAVAPTRDQEVNLLRNQADLLRQQLDQIANRLEELGRAKE